MKEAMFLDWQCLYEIMVSQLHLLKVSGNNANPGAMVHQALRSGFQSTISLGKEQVFLDQLAASRSKKWKHSVFGTSCARKQESAQRLIGRSSNVIYRVQCKMKI
jgi:hypothetical protein